MLQKWLKSLWKKKWARLYHTRDPKIHSEWIMNAKHKSIKLLEDSTEACVQELGLSEKFLDMIKSTVFKR